MTNQLKQQNCSSEAHLRICDSQVTIKKTFQHGCGKDGLTVRIWVNWIFTEKLMFHIKIQNKCIKS